VASLVVHLGLILALALHLELRPEALVDFGLKATIHGSLELVLDAPAPVEEPEETTETDPAPVPEETYEFVEVDDRFEPMDDTFDPPPLTDAPPTPLWCAARMPFGERLRDRAVRVTVEAPSPPPIPAVAAAPPASARAVPVAAAAAAPSALVAAEKLPGHCPPPRYPRAARRRGWEGVVIVDVRIDPDGAPTAVSLRQSAGYRVLDEEVIATLKRWRFSPGRRGAQPVVSTRTLRFVFQIRSGA
jgi:protein TonB